MELRILRYFLTVAREENITRAAEILHISQPALSRQLMQLEDELGVQLFKRGRHSSVLTDEGMLLRLGVVQKSEYCLSALLSRAGLFEHRCVEKPPTHVAYGC